MANEKAIYLDTKSKVRFTLSVINSNKYKINPLNLLELGLTEFTNEINKSDFERLHFDRSIVEEL